jgi:Tol biopolymer transport system component
MKLNGSHLRRLTHPPTKGKGGGPAPADDTPRFSPDGRKIVFIRASGNLPGGGWSGPHGVFTINPNGSHLRQLKDGAWFDPSWQPLP